MWEIIDILYNHNLLKSYIRVDKVGECALSCLLLSKWNEFRCTWERVNWILGKKNEFWKIFAYVKSEHQIKNIYICKKLF